jgi:hypothetical protein
MKKGSGGLLPFPRTDAPLTLAAAYQKTFIRSRFNFCKRTKCHMPMGLEGYREIPAETETSLPK